MGSGEKSKPEKKWFRVDLPPDISFNVLARSERKAGKKVVKFCKAPALEFGPVMASELKVVPVEPDVEDWYAGVKGSVYPEVQLVQDQRPMSESHQIGQPLKTPKIFND